MSVIYLGPEHQGKTVIPGLNASIESWALGRIDPAYLPVSETEMEALDLGRYPNPDELER